MIITAAIIDINEVHPSFMNLKRHKTKRDKQKTTCPLSTAGQDNRMMQVTLTLVWILTQIVLQNHLRGKQNTP